MKKSYSAFYLLLVGTIFFTRSLQSGDAPDNISLRLALRFVKQYAQQRLQAVKTDDGSGVEFVMNVISTAPASCVLEQACGRGKLKDLFSLSFSNGYPELQYQGSDPATGKALLRAIEGARTNGVSIIESRHRNIGDIAQISSGVPQSLSSSPRIQLNPTSVDPSISWQQLALHHLLGVTTFFLDPEHAASNLRALR